MLRLCCIFFPGEGQAGKREWWGSTAVNKHRNGVGLYYLRLAFYFSNSHILGTDIFLWDIVKLTPGKQNVFEQYEYSIYNLSRHQFGAGTPSGPRCLRSCVQTMRTDNTLRVSG